LLAPNQNVAAMRRAVSTKRPTPEAERPSEGVVTSGAKLSASRSTVSSTSWNELPVTAFRSRGLVAVDALEAEMKYLPQAA